MNLKFGPVKIDGLSDMQCPLMALVEQSFTSNEILPNEIERVIQRQFSREDIRAKLKPGMKIAVGVGSRGIVHLDEIVRSTIRELRSCGVEPFIVPAMGSHGGGTAEGQIKVLYEYGITEMNVGAPVRASMDTIHLGTVMGDTEVYFDRMILEEADGYIVIPRIKPHTDFVGPIESGILKMLGIGLGKHRGASYLHRGGMSLFHELIPTVGQLIMERTPLLFAVGIVENAYHGTAHIELVAREQLPAREAELLTMAKGLMPKFLFPEMDVLIVDEIGKDISGCGMDSNIIGRCSVNKDIRYDVPPIHKIVVLGLTTETKGNAAGIGLADYTTERTVQEVDFPAVYANTIAAVEINGGKLPVVLANDKEAILTAILTAGKRNFADVKVVRIKNTLSIDRVYISHNMINDIQGLDSVQIRERNVGWKFDTTGHIRFDESDYGRKRM